MDKKFNIAFDQFQRYQTVARIIEYYRANVSNDKFRVLELGANEHKDLKLFLPQEEIVFTDVNLTEAMKSDKDFIEADGTKLPFEDASFDFVIATDVLEHVNPAKRELFLREAHRVSRITAILSFPFQSKEVAEAEKRVNEYYKVLAGEDFIWLKEHIENGLPTKTEINSLLQNIGTEFVSFIHGDIQTWEKMWYCHFNTVFMPETLSFRHRIDQYYNTNLYLGDIGDSCYRVFLILPQGSRDVWEQAAQSMWTTQNEQRLKFLDVLLQAHQEIHFVHELNELRGLLNDSNSHIQTVEIRLCEKEKQWESEKTQLKVSLDEKVDQLQAEREMAAANLVKEQKKFQREQEKLREELEGAKGELSHYMQHYHAAIAQREDLKRQLAELQNAYNVISNAFFWKITKPFRVILDIIKRPLRKIAFFRLINKGVRCLHENGLKYTWRKVKNKLKNRQEYVEIAKKPLFTEQELEAQRKHVFPKQIKFSIVVPLFNTPEKFLREMIQSVIDQTYSNWELCMADGSDTEHSNVEKICRQYVKKSSRIKYKKLEKNLGISGNTNACLDMATGDYIGLFDHDDLLHPAALHEVMRAVCEQNADFIYTDENTFHSEPKDAFCHHFKPDYAPDTLRSYNYICHFTVFEKKLLNISGNFRSEFDGSQDYDLILRLTEHAKHIVHIPEILYYWRAHEGSVADNISAKPYTLNAAKHALQEHLHRCGLSGQIEDSCIPSTYRIIYELDGNPLVSIIIPNKDHIEDLKKCICSIIEKSTYENYEIIIVENNSVNEETFQYYKRIEKEEKVKIVYWDGVFNYSAINNYGIKEAARGDYLILLNNDIEIITADWIQEMLMFAQRSDVGAVGAMLYYSDDAVQHAGVILGIGGVGGHAHKYYRRGDNGYMSRLTIAQNMSAVTAACMMLPRHVWDEVGGLDESFAVAFNDVDLCMRIRKAGYLIVWTPYAELYHYESKSRGLEDTPEKKKRFEGEVHRFQERWKKELEAGDPYYNPNLTLDREDFSCC